MNETIEFLKRNDWIEYPDQFRKYARCFFKQFETQTRCACDDSKSGIQVCLALSEVEGSKSNGMDLVGELPNGTWIKLHQYGLPEDIDSVLALIPGLLAAWEATCAANRPQA